MNRRRIAGVLLCIAVLVAAGCSGDDDDTSADTTTTSGATTSTTAPSTELDRVAARRRRAERASAPNTLPAVGVGTETELGGQRVRHRDADRADDAHRAGPGRSQRSRGHRHHRGAQRDGRRALDLAGLAVNAHYGDGTPAVPASVQQDALTGTVAPGERKTGKYAFSVPEGQNSSVVVDLQHSGLPNVVIVDASR